MATKSPSHVASSVWQWQPNDWSWTNYANSLDESPDHTAKQKKLLDRYATFSGTGKVSVIPRDEPIPIGKPGSWPPQPPDYVPRPGIHVTLPYVESPMADSQPRPQIRGSFPKLQRSMRSQRPWHSGNPDVISTVGLQTSPASEYTAYQHKQAPRPQSNILFRSQGNL